MVRIMKKVFQQIFGVLVVLSLGFGGRVSAQGFNQDPGNPNLDFSSGNFDHWQLGWGPRTDPDSASGPQPNASSHTIVNITGNNWDGNAGAGNLNRVPSGLQQVARLGAPAGGGYGSPRAYAMKYNIQVNAAYPILFIQLASVMDKTHYEDLNTHYRFSIKNSAGQYVTPQPCGGLELSPRGTASTPGSNTITVPAMGYDNLPATVNIQYQPWESVALDLATYAGQSVTLEIEHYDCWTGFHGSYEYFSAAMRQRQDTFYFCNGANSLLLQPYLPRFKQYSWSNGGNQPDLLVQNPVDGQVLTCAVSSYNSCQTVFSALTKAIYTTAQFTYAGAGICHQIQFTNTSVTNKGTLDSCHWTFTDPATGLSDTSSAMHPLYTFPGPGVYTVKLVVTTTEGCEAEVQHHVTVSSNTAPPAIAWPQPACVGDSLTFADLSSNSTSRSWWLNGTQLHDTARAMQLVFPDSGLHHLMLAAIMDNGCPDTTAGDIYLHPPPQAFIKMLPAIAPVSEPVIAFTGYPAEAAAYAWNFGYNEETGTGERTTFRYPAMVANYPVTLTVINQHGCTDTAQATARIMPPEVYVPGAFTPNKDGVNDLFRIINITNQRLMRFDVYNRYGQQVFHTNQPEQGWDGQFEGGACTVGTYFYFITLKRPDGTLLELKGDVQLIR